MVKPNVYVDGSISEFSSNDLARTQIESLKGKTLDVYYFLVKNPGFHGVRDVQRKLEYSSSSLAAYHLTRLLDAGVVQKNDAGQYAVLPEGDKLGTLEEYVKIINYWVPKTVIYALVLSLLGVGGIVFLVMDVPVISWAILFIPSMFIIAILLVLDGYNLTEKLKV